LANNVLVLNNVVLGYNKSSVVHGVSLALQAGTRTALLGPNGAGKSTLLKGISGFLRCRSGSVTFDGEDVTQLKPVDIVRRGLVHVPEGRRVFSNMTVEENLKVAGHLYRRRVAPQIESVLATFPPLRERMGLPAGLLSGGEQQMLAVGRAMMHQPKLLLLDEVSLGLAPITAQAVYRALDEVFADLTVLLVEQNARLALDRCEYVYVVRNGQISSEGGADRFSDEQHLRAAYLGN
jgi:branched-chain amino acid transport system ATP-binding protein